MFSLAEANGSDQQTSDYVDVLITWRYC